MSQMQGDATSNKNISLFVKSPIYKMKLTSFFAHSSFRV